MARVSSGSLHCASAIFLLDSCCAATYTVSPQKDATFMLRKWEKVQSGESADWDEMRSCTVNARIDPA